MQQDEIVIAFLDNDYKELWKMIAEKNIDALLEQVAPKKTHQSLLSKLFDRKKEKVGINELHQIMYELFSFGESEMLMEQEFKIMNTKSDELFHNLTRLLFTVDINESYPEIEDTLSATLCNATSKIVTEIREKANSYPLNPINGQVWAGGSGMRNAFYYLAYYYQKKGLLQLQLWVVKMRTSITLSIMSHYKEMVGPDMIEIAELEEKLGLHEDALGKYKAVIADFENEMDYFKEDTDIPDESEYAILSSLLRSYQSVDRIANTANYTTAAQLLKQILNRGYPNGGTQ